MRRPLPVLLSCALVLAAAAAGCGRDGDRLTVYSARTRNLVGPLLERFTAQTGIKVDVRYGDSAELALLVQEERDRSPADVFIAQSPGAMGFLDGTGRLAPLDAGVLDRVPAEYRGAAGTWVGLTGRVRTLVYNPDLVRAADLPASVLDLTRPAYRGRVAVAPTNGSFQDFVSALRELAGEAPARAWLDGMARNDPREYANNTAIVEAVARGEVPMGLVNHYYVARARTEDPGAKVAAHFFSADDPGRLLLVTAAGVLASADRRPEAMRLVDYLLGTDAQRFFAEKTFEYPLATGARPVAAVTALARVRPTTLDVRRLGTDLESTIEMIEASGLGG